MSSNFLRPTDFIVTAISTAADEAYPKSKSVRSDSNPISDETMAPIKEKRRLRRQYCQNKYPAIKRAQKQVKDEPRAETQASWKNSATLLA